MKMFLGTTSRAVIGGYHVMPGFIPTPYEDSLVDGRFPRLADEHVILEYAEALLIKVCGMHSKLPNLFAGRFSEGGGDTRDFLDIPNVSDHWFANTYWFGDVIHLEDVQAPIDDYAKYASITIWHRYEDQWNALGLLSGCKFVSSIVSRLYRFIQHNQRSIWPYLGNQIRNNNMDILIRSLTRQHPDGAMNPERYDLAIPLESGGPRWSVVGILDNTSLRVRLFSPEDRADLNAYLAGAGQPSIPGGIDLISMVSPYDRGGYGYRNGDVAEAIRLGYVFDGLVAADS